MGYHLSLRRYLPPTESSDLSTWSRGQPTLIPAGWRVFAQAGTGYDEVYGRSSLCLGTWRWQRTQTCLLTLHSAAMSTRCLSEYTCRPRGRDQLAAEEQVRFHSRDPSSAQENTPFSPRLSCQLRQNSRRVYSPSQPGGSGELLSTRNMVLYDDDAQDDRSDDSESVENPYSPLTGAPFPPSLTPSST